MMANPSEALSTLVEMTRALGQPHLDYVIVGEGNTSLRIDEASFWIKASGQGMHGIDASGFVAVKFAPLLALMDSPPPDLHAAMAAAMNEAKVDPAAAQKPSVEVTFHAALLHDCGVGCIAHTHPLLINQIMCSTRAEEFARRRLFPDQVVLCGPTSVFVPYVDPGLPLALEIRARVRAYMDEYGEFPRVILLANHGLIALGQTPKDALNVTAMCVKAAGIYAGACSIGAPTFMSEADIHHIYRRPDEIYRRRLFQ
jgi:rhamnose utilization protein RhaD (predicted bifunctional aldolase and dehydrogenase)